MEKIDQKHNEKHVKNLTLGLIVSWVLGALFTIGGVGSILSDVLNGVLYLVGAAILLPPFNQLIKQKFKFSISGGIKFVLILILLIIIGTRITGSFPQRLVGFKQSSFTSSDYNKTDTSNVTSIIPNALKTYKEVFTFRGKGAKKSEPFNISGDRFKIAYDCKGGYCGAMLYSISGELKAVILNAVGSIKDETIMYGSGEYYIDANTGGTFTMTVFDYK